jgi:CelD/BcsL family acetyltransferase involved in cellulose biosynthesis
MAAGVRPASPRRPAPPAGRADIAATTFAALADLPAGGAALFAAARDFSLGRAWFDNLIAHGLEPGGRAFFCVLTRGGEALALLPLRRAAGGAASGLTSPYTCLYRPLLAPQEPAGETARRLGYEAGRLLSRQPLARIDSLPAEWPALDAFVAGLAAAGLAVRRFDHFGNWCEPVGGRSWPDYLASRPGRLRELLRRRGRRLQEDGSLRFEVVATPPEVARGIAAYEAVYQRSWKEPEPFPLFTAGLMRTAAREGALRLGICWRDAVPIAAQLWTLAHGRATVMKLAHDEAEKALSPGTLLTAEMIERLLREGAQEIDFGRGDDPYKRLWAGTRRQRIGLMIANPRRPSGLLALARHDLGRARAAARRRTEGPPG